MGEHAEHRQVVRRRRYGLLAGALALGFAAYTGFWFYLAARIESEIALWARESGAEYGDLRISGYPLWLRASAVNARYVRNGREWRAAAVTARTAILDLARSGGKLTSLDMEISDASPGMDPLGLGARLERLSFRAVIEGAAPDGPGPEAVRAWRDNGGVVQLSDFRLIWGPLDLGAEGTLALDAEGRPIGALTARLRGHAGLVDALRASGQLSEGEAQTAKLALGAIAEAVGGDELALALSLQDGEVWLGPVRVARLAPLY